MKLKNLELIVLEVLEEKPVTRTDDFYLWGWVIKKIGISLDTSLKDVLINHKKLSIPSMVSVARCRRKIYETRQDLKNNDIACKREDAEEQYKIYSRGGDV